MPAAPVEIELGQVAEDGLRYWRAKEALRQGELRLVAQSAALATFEARATSVVGWAVAGSTSLVALTTVVALPGGLRFGAVLAVVLLFLAAICGARVIGAGDWRAFGAPASVLDSSYASEVEDLEAMAGGLAIDIGHNEERLADAGRRLAWALRWAAAAPPAVLAGWLAGHWVPALTGWLPSAS
jgi:hypothetical protein